MDLEFYIEQGLQENDVFNLNAEIALPVLPPRHSLSPFARPRRAEMLHEAISWAAGTDQANRIVQKLYQCGNFDIGAGKPGKEAAPGYNGCRHYITGQVMNNCNDMNPCIIKDGIQLRDLTFEEAFEHFEHLMRADLLGLEILGMLLYRMAFMLDHKNNEDNQWRYEPPNISLEILQLRLRSVDDIPIEVLLYFLDVLALNEDVKVHTLGYEDARYDYGRINTLLTFAHLVAVLLNRRSLARFAGSFARPPSGMAPLPKIQGLFETYPLLSPHFP